MSRKKKNLDAIVYPNGEAPPVESKADKFRRLAMARVPKAVARLRQIGALANASQYEWTEQQRDKILLTLADEYKRMKDRFSGVKVAEEAFTL